MNRPLLAAIPFSLSSLVMLAASATAQVRTNLRNTMQIDGLVSTLPSGASADERFWPIEVNGFAHGDIDGDGDLDLLAAGAGQSRVWFNDGGGSFVRFTTIPGEGARCALFDADGDGDLDALIGGGRISYGGPTPSYLFRNDGVGVFTQSAIPPATPRTRTLSTGDIDGDGDRDVLFFGEAPTLCVLWRNAGGAVFHDVTVNVARPVTAAANGTLADIEPDGDLDIVFQAPGSTLCETRINDGSGAFSLGPSVAFTIPTADAAMADLDGDGLLDQVGVRASGMPGPLPADPVVYVRRNTGSGFQDVTAAWFPPHALVDHSIGFDSRVCAVFDVDGDGDPDMVTGGSEQKGLGSTTVGVPPKVFLNVERQRFLDAGRPAFPFLQDVATAMDAGDIDGDGDVDLVTFAHAYYGTPSADIWRQNGAGCFAEAGLLPFPSTPGFSALQLVDVDGDGDRDLLGVVGWGETWPGVPGQHRLAKNDGLGNFTDVTATHMPSTANSGGASCAAGDVDGDGDVDLVIGSYDSNWGGPGVPLMLLVNGGTGVFSDASAQMPSVPFESGHLALRDFDGDGDLDLAVGLDRFHTNTRRLLFFANNGSGAFSDQTASRLPLTSASTGLHVLDLDNDGDLDIAQSDVDLVNDGTGHFTATSVAGLPRLLVADLDGDGAVEAIADSGSALWVVGGRMVFQSWGWGNIGHRLMAADLDNDADLDLVASALWIGATSDLQLTRSEVIYNLRRDRRVVTHPRLGQAYRMQLRATNGTQPTLGLVLIAAATLSQPLAIPDLGYLVLDPAAIIPWSVVVIPDSDTAAEAVVNIQNQPALHGLPLSCQALLIPVGAEQQTHLTNAMTHTIER